MWPASKPRLFESTAAAEDRAVQDPLGIRQGAPHRQGGRRHLDRGAPGTSRPSGTRRSHLLKPPFFWGPLAQSRMESAGVVLTRRRKKHVGSFLLRSRPFATREQPRHDPPRTIR